MTGHYVEHKADCATGAGHHICSCSDNERDCIHGLLKRACQTCELDGAYASIDEYRRIVLNDGKRRALLEAVLAAARDVSAHDVDSVQVLREAIRLCDATTGEGEHE